MYKAKAIASENVLRGVCCFALSVCSDDSSCFSNVIVFSSIKAGGAEPEWSALLERSGPAECYSRSHYAVRLKADSDPVSGPAACSSRPHGLERIERLRARLPWQCVRDQPASYQNCRAPVPCRGRRSTPRTLPAGRPSREWYGRPHDL